MRGRSVVWLALALGLAAAPARAQIVIESSTPSADALLDEAPAEVTVEGDRGLSPRSRLSVLRCGRRTSEGRRQVSGSRVAITLRTSDPGVYDVRYRLVAAGGGGARRGSFSFTVGEGGCDAADQAPGIWDIPLDDFALALGIAALIGAAGGHVYAGIVRPRP